MYLTLLEELHIDKLLSDWIGSPQRRIRAFLGKHFKGKNLDGHNLSMSLLIAANLEQCSLRRTNFLGADMRDANIKNTDLSESLFLTQMQINSAKGNTATKLPAYLERPSSWQPA